MAYKSTIQEGLWGLDRLDQLIPPYDGQFRYNSDGGGVDVCIIDTGILSSHIEFGSLNSVGRVQVLYDYRSTLSSTDPDYIPVTDVRWGQDDNGHGTFIASIVGGFTTGVAHGCKLYSVKIFNRNLETNRDRMFAGLNSVYTFHTTKSNSRPSICLITWAGFTVDDSDTELLINQMINSGITVICTAGNYDRDINLMFPSRMTNIITVGGSDKNDKFVNPALINDTSFKIPSPSGNESSNFGAITLIAPSFRIRGAWITTNNPVQSNYSSLQSSEYRIMSNNAVAASFTTGVAALYLDKNPSKTHLEVKDFLINTSIKNRISGLPLGTPNRLLRSTFNPHVFVWDKESGQLMSVEESNPVDITITAYGQDGAGSRIPVDFSVSSGSLPPDFILEKRTGRIYGSAPEISSSTPGYIPVASLPIEEQILFADNHRGYVDYIFTLKIQDEYSSETRVFSIRVVDLNQTPVWRVDKPFYLNDAVSARYFYYKNTVNFNLNTLNYISDGDGDNITFHLLNGELPKNLHLSSNGRIQGTVAGITPETYTYPTSAGTIWKDYLFTVRAFDGLDNVDRYMGIRIYRDGSNNTPPEFFQKDWSYGPLEQYYEGGVINITFTTNDPDGDKVLYYKVQPFTNYDIPPETFAVVSSQLVDHYYDASELILNDSDWYWTGSPYVEGSIPATAKVYHRTPIYVKVNISGKMQGVLTVLNNVGNYYFTIDAYDGWDITRETFLIHVDPLEINIITALASLDWVEDPGLLGEIWETYPSYFKVEAYTNSGKEINYEFIPETNSALPPGIILDTETGELRGYFQNVTVNTTYNFIIRAYLKETPEAYIDGEFSIKVINKWTASISELSFYMSGYQKLHWYNTIANELRGDIGSQILPIESWYRPLDPIYGENWSPKIYIMGGMLTATDSQLYDLMKKETLVNDSKYETFSTFFSPIEVVIGDLKSAIARDLSGNVIYEVIYYEIYDSKMGNKGISELGVSDPIANDDPTSPVKLFYPTSILNWRRDIRADLPPNNGVERLPLWMMSSQETATSNDKPGYVPCIELVYVLPGTASNFINLVKTIPNTIYKKGETIQIDRLVYTDLTNPNLPVRKVLKFPPGDIAL